MKTVLPEIKVNELYPHLPLLLAIHPTLVYIVSTGIRVVHGIQSILEKQNIQYTLIHGDNMDVMKSESVDSLLGPDNGLVVIDEVQKWIKNPGVKIALTAELARVTYQESTRQFILIHQLTSPIEKFELIDFGFIDNHMNWFITSD